MAVKVPLEKTKQNLDTIFKVADQRENIVITHKRKQYLIHKIYNAPLTEAEAVRIGRQAEADYRAGRTQPFESFVRTHYPEYGELLGD